MKATHLSARFRRMEGFASGWTLLISLVVAKRPVSPRFIPGRLSSWRCTCVTCETSLHLLHASSRSLIPGISARPRAVQIATQIRGRLRVERLSHSLFSLLSVSLKLAQRYRFRSRFREAFAQPRSIFTTRLEVPIARPFRFGRSLSRARP